MRVTDESLVANIGLHNSETGETIGAVDAILYRKHKNYSIKRLNMKIWQEGLDRVMNEVISSNTDTRLFNYIKSLMDKNGQILINQTHIASEFNLSRQKIATFIKKLINTGFIHKVVNGVYIINPFIIRPKGMSNEDCEAAQTYWASIYGIPNK